ncbi:hypothetical protein QTO34_018304 [Cnephaeus nilssonii]|uniref:Glyceraldehyde 3-phosphate dehydrogenase NAD(P) binding domain-containing protein n=1 Tax=Cnephaeus nilssonii TaxID=3371016 RepID=A0AA40LPV3_CNENI|nr:hypothetical protein QTO34_018304 [Eptesicus nilssonii]
MTQTLSSRRQWRRELSVLLAQSATPATLSPAPCASCWPNRGRSGVMPLLLLSADTMVKVRVNRFGRIGRLITRATFNSGKVDIVTINDPFIDLNYMLYIRRLKLRPQAT